MVQKKQVLNFICVVGCILAILSIPVHFIFIGQIVSLIFCFVGLYDCKKCNNSGSTFAVVGIVIDIVLLIMAPFTIVGIVKAVSSGLGTIDKENINLLLRIALIILRLC